VEEIGLRRLTRADFSLLSQWLSRAHVARWWNHAVSPAQVEADFGQVVDGEDPCEVFIAEIANRPFGLIQRYTFADNPGYLAEVGCIVEIPEGTLSMDYFVAEPSLLNRGYGAAMARVLLTRTWEDYKRAPSVIVPVAMANVASQRMLENAGMQRVAVGLLTPDNPLDSKSHFVYRIDRPRHS
jgi:aminoglycoside 6'-N-acetyltransferase